MKEDIKLEPRSECYIKSYLNDSVAKKTSGGWYAQRLLAKQKHNFLSLVFPNTAAVYSPMELQFFGC